MCGELRCWCCCVVFAAALFAGSLFVWASVDSCCLVWLPPPPPALPAEKCNGPGLTKSAAVTQAWPVD